MKHVLYWGRVAVLSEPKSYSWSWKPASESGWITIEYVTDACNYRLLMILQWLPSNYRHKIKIFLEFHIQGLIIFWVKWTSFCALDSTMQWNLYNFICNFMKNMNFGYPQNKLGVLGVNLFLRKSDTSRKSQRHAMQQLLMQTCHWIWCISLNCNKTCSRWFYSSYCISISRLTGLYPVIAIMYLRNSEKFTYKPSLAFSGLKQA